MCRRGYPKNKKKDIRVLTVEEQREVVEHAKGRMHENMILVALGTGLRSGELRGLTWEDINFQKREISINKTLVYIKDIEQRSMYSSTRHQRQRTVCERFLCRRAYTKH